MSPGELRDAIGGAIGPGHDRKSVEIAAEIVAKRRRRAVAFVRILSQRFEHDRVEIATEGAASIALRHARRRRRILLADDPFDLRGRLTAPDAIWARAAQEL